MKRLRVLVLMHEHLVPPDSVEGMSYEEIHPFKMELDVMQALEELGHEVRPLPLGTELSPIRQAIEEWKPHIAFNLLMSFHEIGIYDAHVVSYLELLKTPYTGANPRGILLASDKPLSKKILTYHRIPVPGFAVFRRKRAVRKPSRLRFPLIVKSTVEHSSVGIAQASIVNDDKALAERVGFVHRNIGTEAIAEEYIEGREITIGVLGNERLKTFPLWEMTFENLPPRSEPIATSRVKFDFEYQEKVGVRIDLAKDIPEKKAAEIARLAKRIYRALSLSGFARVDLRLAPDGKVFVLEANPNPDLCNNEDFALSAAEAGLEYNPLIQRILNLGQSYLPAWKDR